MDERRRPETDQWREQLLLTLAHWGALFGGVIAIGVTIRALAFDFVDVSHPAFAAMFVGYGAIVALRLLPGLPYLVRAVTLSAACFIAAGGAVLLRGLAPAPVLLVGLGVVIAALFLGRAGMLGGLLLAAATVAIIGRPEPPEAFSPWSSAIDFVCVAGVLTVLVQFVVSRLERSLAHTSQALAHLQTEQALREHAQDQLTQAQATLQQTQKLDAVGRLAGGVAHDFNNTLQVVLGWTELLRSETHSQQIQDGIEQIRSAAERSRGLTRQLLAFSRPELNQPTRVELHTFLPALIKSYRRLLPDDISIVAHTVEGLAILMDEGHLSQVLLNIVLNARDAMPAGGTIAVMAKFIPRAELPSTVDGFDNGAVEIEIIDTGTGMDEETRSRVFEPFFTTKGKRGTALGLATAYGVVQLARGVIDIHSERGKGTSVRLIFPALTGSADAPLSGRPASLRSAEQAVLLAEDDSAVRTTLARALRQAGHRVVEVSDVEAGRVVVRERGAEFDVLVTDGIMPGGSTRQLIDDFLTARPNARVIICSGYIEDELSIRDLGEQTFEFVQKPFSPSELVARLGSATQSRKVTVPADR
ncbi:MAG TPA: ATP-binding protein [Vicinamibacterales bacterium]|nr:ATP-binding protein [Vicinamibacterales bacterium]